MALTFVPPAALVKRADRTFTQWVTITLVVLDALVLMLASSLALTSRDNLPIFHDSNDDYLHLIGPYTLLFTLGWLSVIALFGGYRTRVRVSGTAEYRAVVRASGTAAAALGIGAYLTHYPLSRGFFVIFFVFGTLLLVAGRHLARRTMHRLHERGVGRSRVLLAGSEVHVRELIEVLDRERWLGYSVVGALLNDTVTTDLPRDVVHLGRPEDALHALKAVDAHVIIFGEGSFARTADFSRLARQFEDHDAQLVMVPGLSQVSAERIDVRPMAGLPLVYVDRPQALAAARWAKRLFDLAGSVSLLVLLSPVLAVCALLVKGNDGGPVLFRQTRIGRGGRSFTMMKFRSMVVDAEKHTETLVATPRTEGNAVMFKLAHDPRITRVGGAMRRFSLDELPQLLNVVKGDMSLVGPRPALAREVNLYDDEARRRLDVRPGMTGLWQVSGRSDLSWEDTVRLDVYYVDNWSMVQDVAILSKTLRAVIGSDGAY